MTDELITTTGDATSNGTQSNPVGGNSLVAQPVPVPTPPTPPDNLIVKPPTDVLAVPTVPVEKVPNTETSKADIVADTGNNTIKKVGDDVKKILATIKLPERRNPPASETQREIKKEPATFDTALGATVAKPKEGVDGNAPAGQSAVPVQNAASAPSTNASEKPGGNAQGTITRVHTLKDDMQEVVRENKISLVRAVALEQEKKGGQERFANPEAVARTRRSRRIIIISLIVMLLIISGGIFLYSTYSLVRGGINTKATPQDTSLIFAEKTIAFPLGTLTAADIKRLLAQARQPSSPLGSITRIKPISQVDTDGVLHDQPVTIEMFLRTIGAQVTPDLIRAFLGDFFLGIHAVEKNAPILIIPVSSYERAFAGMLAWEPTMNGDLSPLFTPVPPQTTDSNGLPVERKFQDAILYNYDVRVLRDDAGAIELLYSFPTRSILIIAESPNSFAEILSRLRASRHL